MLIKKNQLKIIIPIVAVVVIAAIALRKQSSNQYQITDPIKRSNIVESVFGIGTVTAKNSYQLKVGITSGVSAIFVREGEQVQKGQRLITLEGGTSFSAPFDGTITYLPVKVGETVFPQSIVMSVVDLLDRYLIVSLEQRAAMRVRVGQKARISFDSQRDLTFEGIVQAVYSNESNFLVRITVNSLPNQILPGMTADVAITIGEHKDALVIPIAAIENSEVMVKSGSSKKSVPVKTGIVDGAYAEIVSGDLKEGDQLFLRQKIK